MPVIVSTDAKLKKDKYEHIGMKHVNTRTLGEASIASFNRGDNTGFISIFSRCIVPLHEYKNYRERLNTDRKMLRVV